ncbi:hypothetical protein EJB05_27465, partial [Eragrostis curvula]
MQRAAAASHLYRAGGGSWHPSLLKEKAVACRRPPLARIAGRPVLSTRFHAHDADAYAAKGGEALLVFPEPRALGDRRCVQDEAEQPVRGHGGTAKAKSPPSPDVAEDTQYNMFVFFPDDHDGISTMVDVVTAAPAFLYGILAEMKKKPVNIKLPKFNISFSWNELKRDLCQLGLSLPFSAEAGDLRGMCKEDNIAVSRRPTFLSKIAHKAIVKVNESGTEAAAATPSLRGGGGPPPDLVEFIANHPFTFFIMEERSWTLPSDRHRQPAISILISSGDDAAQ